MFLLFVISMSITLLSCTDDTSFYQDEVKTKSTNENSLTVFYAESEFSKALAKVLAEKEEARVIIRDEALKKINFDNDVLYLLIKDKTFSDGTTFEENMLLYMDSVVLETLTFHFPTLTILVPDLPEDSFSLEKWDVTTQIPMVAMNAFEGDDILYFDSNGQEIQESKNKIPTFPVLGIKVNERIVANNANVFTRSNSGISFSFIDESFNNTNPLSEMETRALPIPSIPSELEKAYQAFNIYGTSNTGWQRDYVYYDITPTSPRGELNVNYEETLIAFSMKHSNGDAALALIENQDEDAGPDRNHIFSNRSTPHPNNGWLEGLFEFIVKYNTGLATSPERFKYFGAQGKELFDIKYKEIGGGWRGYSHVITKTYTLPNGGLPLFVWDLENHTSNVILKIEEVDSEMSTTISETITTDYAANFELNPSKGIFEKVGLKFGASGKKTKQMSWSITTTEGNDILGSCDLRIDQIFLRSANNMAEWRTDRRTGQKFQSKWVPDAYVCTGGYFDAQIIPTKRY